MSLIIKRLRSLPINTRIHVSYGFMDGQTLAVTGIVIDKDDSAMEIRDDAGIPSFINFDTVRFFSIPAHETGADNRAVNAPVAQQNIIPEPPQAVLPQKTLLCRKDVEQLTLGVSDQELKQVFDGLCREEKKLLQKAVDSFFYGVRCNSPEKRNHAALTAFRTILQQDQAGFDWSAGACHLVALMRSRIGVWDTELYARAKRHEEAAICGFRNRDHLTAGRNAAMALMNPDCSRTEDMQIILSHACAELQDVSPLVALDAAGVCVAELAEDLLLHLNKQTGSSTAENLSLLKSLYTGTAMADAITCEEDVPQEETLVTGMISKVLWVNNTGEITFPEGSGEQTVPFRYGEVIDPMLAQKLESLGTELAKQHFMVRFQLEKGEAVQIRHGATPLNLAHEALGQCDFVRACWFCRNALGTTDAQPAMVLMVDAALASDDNDLIAQTMDFYDANRTQYPRGSKNLSLLGQLFHARNRLEEALRATEDALEDVTAPAKLRASILIQYMSYAMDLYNATGAERWLRGLNEKADLWLKIFQEQLSEEYNCIKRHSKVLNWKIRGLLALGRVDEAEAVYDRMARKFPDDAGLAVISGLICQSRQKLLKKKQPLATPKPAFTLQEEVPEPQELPEVPNLDGAGNWEDLDMSREDFVRQVLAMDGPNPLASQLTALKIGSMLNPDLLPLYDTLSVAVNSPLEAQGCEPGALTRLLSDADSRYPVLNQFAAASLYLRLIFQNDTAPLWLRQCICDERIGGLPRALDLLEDFRKLTGHSVDRYAAYRDDFQRAEDRRYADLLHRAQRLYDTYVATPSRDNGSFSRFAHTKSLAHNELKPYLEWVLQEDREALLGEKERFCSRFLTSDLRVSPEKVDKFIISTWESTARDYPNGDSAVLQGSRRNTLRSSVRAIAALVGDVYRHMTQSHTQLRSEDGIARFAMLRPGLEDALNAVSIACTISCRDPEEQTGRFLMRYTARELLDKLSGCWQEGQEQYLFCDFLTTNQVPLNDNFLPDLSGMLTGPLGLMGRIFAHARMVPLESQQHIDRIFSRDQLHFRNFDTAELIRRYSEITCTPVTMPDAERYINQAKLIAKLEFDALRQTLQQDGCTESEQQLLWLYDTCCRKLRFGFLAEGMDILRGIQPEQKGDKAA